MQQRDTICSLGELGATTGRAVTIQPHQRKAASWMQRQNLACINSNGHLILDSSGLVFATCLSQAKKMEDPSDPRLCSLWSLRRRMRREGWTDAKSGRYASVEGRSFNPKNEFSDYYAILLTRISSVQAKLVCVLQCV